MGKLSTMEEKIFLRSRNRSFAKINTSTQERKFVAYPPSVPPTRSASVVPAGSVVLPKFFTIASMRNCGRFLSVRDVCKPAAEISILKPSIFVNMEIQPFPILSCNPNSPPVQPIIGFIKEKARMIAAIVEINPKKHSTNPFFADIKANASKTNAIIPSTAKLVHAAQSPFIFFLPKSSIRLLLPLYHISNSFSTVL